MAIGLGFRALTQVGYLQIFEIDRIVRSHQLKRGLMVEVVPLPLHLLVLSSEQVHCLLAALAALLFRASWRCAFCSSRSARR